MLKGAFIGLMVAVSVLLAQTPLQAASRAMIDDYPKKTHTAIWIEHDFRANAKLKKALEYYD